MTTKEFSINTKCSATELASKTNAGWQIQYMQFMQDGTLHVVFFREVTVAQPAAAAVVSVPAVPVVNKPLPAHMSIVGLCDEPERSVPLTHNKPKPWDTRKVNVPKPDPVMEEALKRGRDTFDRVRAEGEAKIKNARPSFMRNQ